MQKSYKVFYYFLIYLFSCVGYVFSLVLATCWWVILVSHCRRLKVSMKVPNDIQRIRCSITSAFLLLSAIHQAFVNRAFWILRVKDAAAADKCRETEWRAQQKNSVEYLLKIALKIRMFSFDPSSSVKLSVLWIGCDFICSSPY